MPQTPSAAEHYERLLAAHYTWMLGGDIRPVAQTQAELLERLGVLPRSGNDVAVDLGCGPGPQSLALARLGYATVFAVDTSARLLDELSEYAKEAPAIRPVRADIREALPRLVAAGSASTVVCMGDTLTHLPAAHDVTRLMADAAHCLADGGLLVLTYRDLSTPLSGADRFLPVRATDDRIMTCFVESGAEDTVTVHDLIHTRTEDGWSLQVGSYAKLRLAPAWVAEQCRAAGLRVQEDGIGPRGLRLLTVVKGEE
ncbi:class I SAM-dependent methyltransferase [Kitasatospora phosalacinea]|uniref:class I SAM-dependent methyltransferase n=1 Tax=Kitasatospora phosalacinea TaxID=2065 RepID=UPI000526F6D7|nr:class I SAM-dependent methyltransferase [Kitasatospora phosalacinea]